MSALQTQPAVGSDTPTGRSPRRRRWRSVLVAVALAALVVVGLLAGLPRSSGSAPRQPDGVRRDPALNQMWRAYGNAGGHWTGGDCAASVPLPDGRIAWLFCDTFLGSVNLDHTRPANAPVVHNVIVVQQGQNLTTLTGGDVFSPGSLVGATSSGVGTTLYWPNDGIVENGQLCVFYGRMVQTGPGPLDFQSNGTGVGCFALPGLTGAGFTALPVSGAITWGTAVLAEGQYIYLYGVEESTGNTKYLHVARARRGALLGPWEFYTGFGWSLTELSSARLLGGVGHGLDVERINGQYVLVSVDDVQTFSPNLVAYTASSPVGPFGAKRRIYTAPEARPGGRQIVYDARIHPEINRPGEIVVSYNVNSLTPSDLYADVRIYRPRFVDVRQSLLLGLPER